MTRLYSLDGPPAVRERPSAVYSRLAGGHATIRSRLPSYKIVLDGVETYRVGTSVIRVSAGQMLVVRKGVETAFEASGAPLSSGLCLYLNDADTIGFPGAFVRTRTPERFDVTARFIGDAIGSGRREDGVLGEALSDARRMCRVMGAKMRRRYLRLAIDREGARCLLLSKLEAARAYIEDQADKPLDLARLSRLSGVSKFHLSRHFRSVYQVSPIRFWARERLMRAMDQEKRRPGPRIDVISENLGYSDRYSFERAFRRHLGVTPRDYLRGSICLRAFGGGAS